MSTGAARARPTRARRKVNDLLPRGRPHTFPAFVVGDELASRRDFVPAGDLVGGDEQTADRGLQPRAVNRTGREMELR